jgi:hypothetical protein
LSETLDELKWLYRGAPAESPEVEAVKRFEEVRPSRPDRTGEDWRLRHSAGMTDTGYTSWTTDRSLAQAAAIACSEGEGLSGQTQIFRVRINTLNQDRIFEERADEDEYLIEGAVENVQLSNDPTDEEDD